MFGKDITFAQFYDVLKRHKEYIFNKKFPHWSCLCQIYENALLMVNGLNKKLYPESGLPATINELVAKLSCEDVEKCMFGKCEKYSSKIVCHEDFNVDLIADSDSEHSNTSDSDCADNDQTAIFAYYEWAREATKLKKMLFKESIDSAIRKFTSTITELKHHVYVNCVQFNHYSSIKINLGRNDILVHGDCSGGYENKQQH